MKILKIVLGVLLLVLLVGGGFGYWKWTQAEKDTDRITTGEATEETTKLASIHSSADLDALAKDLGDADEQKRLAAAKRLVELHAEKKDPKALELLKGAVDKESNAVTKNVIESHLAAEELAAAAPEARLETLKRFAADTGRPGYRIVAAQELAKETAPEAKELLGTLAKDTDEYVQIAAEMALEGDTDGE